MELFDTVHIALERAIQGSGLLHQALAENLANVNTPGYRRQDVDFHTALQAAMPAGRDAVAAELRRVDQGRTTLRGYAAGGAEAQPVYDVSG